MTMRFMVILKGEAEPGKVPDGRLFGAMLKFNDQMVKAGVLLAGEGLTHSSSGARITVTSDGKRTVTDGPFTETKELVAGIWLIQVKSKEEALEWASRAPVEYGLSDGEVTEVEVRQVAEATDFPTMTEAQRAKEDSLREQIANRDAG
jgi:hypothetical protein